MSEIQRFYDAKTVFLTGGTGFLGKLIMQKLLKTTNVRTIYLIIRPKRNVSVEERTKQLLEHELFSEVRHKISKIKAFSGDLTRLGLGLSDEDRQILQNNVNIIIHCGAILSFVSNIQESVFSNLRSTREMLTIAKRCKKLVAFLYVSTAYSNCPESVIEEKFFDPPVSPELLIQMAEQMDEETLSRISIGLRGAWPNYYCFTKIVSESLIKKAAESLPVGLFRPCIVISTADDPIKGWTDNLYGPLGILLSINLGVIRIVKSDATVKLDLVPADKVTNAILCTLWEVDQRWKKTKGLPYAPPILNFSARSSPLHVSLKYLLHNVRIAMNSAVWYPTCVLVQNPLLFRFLDKLLHILPYYSIDKIALFLGKKPTATRVFNKVAKACEALFVFMHDNWTIKNDNVIALWGELNDSDKNLYNFDLSMIEPREYFQSLAVGLKQYVAKEDIENIDQHENKIWRLKIFHFLTIGLIITVLFLAGINYPLILLLAVLVLSVICIL